MWLPSSDSLESCNICILKLPLGVYSLRFKCGKSIDSLKEFSWWARGQSTNRLSYTFFKVLKIFTLLNRYNIAFGCIWFSLLIIWITTPESSFLLSLKACLSCACLGRPFRTNWDLRKILIMKWDVRTIYNEHSCEVDKVLHVSTI